jgi:D-glycero-alpha-D-manno-heptose 1-phosphate guanylyltransferase
LLLDLLRAQGMRRVILATGHMAGQIEAFVGGDWAGMEIDYSHESSPLGTGGAVQRAVARLQGDGVHVLNGDTFLRYAPSALAAVASRIGAGIGIALAHVDDVARYGAVSVRDGRVTAFHEKGAHGPGLINAGSYYFSRAGLALLERAVPFSLETEVLVPQARAGDVAAFCETSGFIDIGVPEDYARAQRIFDSRT